MRSAAKAVSFGIHTHEPPWLSIATGMTYEQAGKFIKHTLMFESRSWRILMA